MQIAEIDDVADAIRAAAGPVTMTVTAQTTSWGYLRVFREDASGEWQQVGRRAESIVAEGRKREDGKRPSSPRAGATWSA